MKKGLRLLLCFLLILLPCIASWAVDFGLLLDQTGGVSGTGSSTNTDYTASLIPRFSAFLGENGEFFASASGTAEYKAETWTLIPELLRTDFFFRFNGGDFRIGRMYYSDPLGFITDGLFDGAQIGFYTPIGILSAGGWYTGFLYKNRANIVMTEKDAEDIGAEIDYSDFVNTYFASRRFVAALGWEHPGLGGYVRSKLSVLAQFDNTGEGLNTQYFVAKFSVPFSSFLFDLGGTLELKELSGEVKTALAGEAALSWMLPTSIDDRLAIMGRTSTGSTEIMSSFVPVTTVAQGSILKPKITGLSVIGLDYIARITQSFGLSLSSNYFIRNDFITFMSYPVTEGNPEAYFMGNEFFGWLLWSPVSDLRINLGGGIFLPSMGNVAPDAYKLWRIELNVILALF